MNSQFGFDFGAVAEFKPIEMARGTWNERRDDDVLPGEVEAAKLNLGEAPVAVIDLYKAGVEAATKTVNDIRSDTRHGQFRCYELRAARVEPNARDLEDFIARCRAQTKAGPTIGRVSWKVREAFDFSTYAVHVENVGTLLAQSRRVNDPIEVSFVPGLRGSFFLDSYEDSMQSIALPYDVWGPTYAEL